MMKQLSDVFFKKRLRYNMPCDDLLKDLSSVSGVSVNALKFGACDFLIRFGEDKRVQVSSRLLTYCYEWLRELLRLLEEKGSMGYFSQGEVALLRRGLDELEKKVRKNEC